MSHEFNTKNKNIIEKSEELNNYNYKLVDNISNLLELEAEIKNKINNYFILQNRFILQNKQIIYITDNYIVNTINSILYKINLKITELYELKKNSQLNYKESLKSSKIMEKLNKISLCNECSECIYYDNSIEEFHILNIDNFINVYLSRINAFINYCNKTNKLKDNRQKLLDSLNDDINITNFINNFIRYKCRNCFNIQHNNNIKNNIQSNTANFIKTNENLNELLKNNFC